MRISRGTTETELNPENRFHGVGGGSLLRVEQLGDMYFVLCMKEVATKHWVLVDIANGMPWDRFPGETEADLKRSLEWVNEHGGYEVRLCGTKTDVVVYE